MTLFQPLWPTRPGPAELQRGWNELEMAKELGPVTPLESAFIETAAAFFSEPESKDYWLRITRWEAAAEQTYASFPHDSEASVLYALAHLATTPASVVTREHADRAAGILLDVYRDHPDHPGVMHYLIHANDVPGRERELLEVTRRYEVVAPNNPHALHMPTHIYTRLGDWNGVIRGNLRAAEAALQYPAGDRGELVWDEFPHAIEYLVYAYLQTGDDQRAHEALTRLRSTPHLEPTFKTAFHLASTRSRYAVERKAWNEASQVEVDESPELGRFTWPLAITVFARGLGSAHLGHVDDARSVALRLDDLARRTRESREELFARNIDLLALELRSWIAHVENDRDESVALMRKAAALEAETPKHAVTPGPVLPALELLGDLLMEQSDPQGALEAYRQSLDLYPRRFNSLLGGARAAKEAGDEATARELYLQLLDGSEDSNRPSVAEAREFVARHPSPAAR